MIGEYDPLTVLALLDEIESLRNISGRAGIIGSDQSADGRDV